MNAKASVILFLVATSAVANPDPTPIELLREPDSANIGNAEVSIQRIGTRFRGQIRIPPESVPQGDTTIKYRYKINPDANTYKIIEVEQTTLASPTKLIAPHIPEPGDGCPCGGAECQGHIDLTVRNWAWESLSNPVEVLFTKTRAFFGYKRYVDYVTRTCKWKVIGPSGVTCTILNPNPFTWFPNGVNPCGQAGPTAPSDGVAHIYGQGSYKNKNWANPLAWSYVTDVSQPGINHGVLEFDWDHYPSGDNAPFLFGEIEVTYSNTCMS